jgi:CheY-like chemotaxis protein
MNHPHSSILLIEDNEDDILFLKRSFAKAEVSLPLVIKKDGLQAIEHLTALIDKSNPFSNEHLPSLALLDLKLPLKNGFEVLSWIRSQPQLEHLPVLILSSSNVQKDIDRAHRLGATGYLVKPSSLDRLLKLVQMIKMRWLEPEAGMLSQSEPFALEVR